LRFLKLVAVGGGCETREQPRWITPLATTTPRLEQEFRYDIQWQTHNNGVTTDNYGVSKGLEIIPQTNTEVILALPPYIVNNPDSPNDGFGDWQFLVKYRILSANEERGNYILTCFYQMSLPTGQYHQPYTLLARSGGQHFKQTLVTRSGLLV
jgi:hypothetical protein